MRLYIIRRKSDGLYLRKTNPHYSIHSGQDKTEWTDKLGTLLRTPEGVAMNLRKLCSTPYFTEGDWPWRELSWKDFRAQDLLLYEVVCMEVDIVNMKVVPAPEFVQLDKVATIPLTKTERNQEA